MKPAAVKPAAKASPPKIKSNAGGNGNGPVGAKKLKTPAQKNGAGPLKLKD